MVTIDEIESRTLKLCQMLLNVTTVNLQIYSKPLAQISQKQNNKVPVFLYY